MDVVTISFGLLGNTAVEASNVCCSTRTTSHHIYAGTALALDALDHKDGRPQDTRVDDLVGAPVT